MKSIIETINSIASGIRHNREIASRSVGVIKNYAEYEAAALLNKLVEVVDEEVSFNKEDLLASSNTARYLLGQGCTSEVLLFLDEKHYFGALNVCALIEE